MVSKNGLGSDFNRIAIQGGAMNRGLLFAGLPPPPLGGCERKD